MRDIKFRVWDSKNKKWLSAVPSLEYLLDNEDACISHHDIDPESAIYKYPSNILGKDFGGRIVWQQYTGLQDSTGKEIYEGDIVSFRMPFSDNRKQKIGEIKYGQFSSSHEAGYSRGHIHVGFYPELNGKTLYDFDDEDVDWRLSTVIGNIFETPELLQ